MIGGYDPHDIGGISPPPEILQFHSNVIQNLSFGTPLFNGHLHSVDTKFGLGKTLT